MPRRPEFAAEFEIAHHTTGNVHSITVRSHDKDLVVSASIALSPWPPPGGQVNSQIARRPRPLDEAGLDVLHKGLRLLVHEINAYKRSAAYRAAMTDASPELGTSP